MNKSEINPVIKCVAFSIPATILFFAPGYLDPINLPKLIILVPLVFTSLVLFFTLNKYITRSKFSRDKLILVLLYLALALTMCISGIAGSANYVRVIFGTFGRNNGLLYYLLVICFALILLSLTILEKDLAYFNKIISSTSIIFACYCLIQFLNFDPVSWSNPYNRVIGTLGNPNFSASALAIFAGYWLYRFIRVDKNKKIHKVLSLSLSILMAFLSWSTNSLQGPVVYLLAVILVLFVWARERYPFGALPLLFGFGIALSTSTMLFSFMGKGPLGTILEQYTLKLRVSYAHIGLRAIIDSPIFGEGVDNYISAFRTLRTSEFVAQNGFELSVNNAHSSPVQIGVSFGLLVFVIHIVIQVLILTRAISILNSRDSKLIHLKGISILWLLVFSQSLMSIEIIGLGVMNWILGAALLSSRLSVQTEGSDIQEKVARISKQKVLPAWTGALIISSISVTSLVFIPITSDDRAFRNIVFLNVNSVQNQEIILENYKKLTGLTFFYPNKLDAIVPNLISAGLKTEVEELVKQLYSVDSKDAYAVNLLATYYLNSGDLKKEIHVREMLRPLDPWNEKLELDLARAYSKAGDETKLKDSINRIYNLNSASPYYQEALVLLRN